MADAVRKSRPESQSVRWAKYADGYDAILAEIEVWRTFNDTWRAFKNVRQRVKCVTRADLRSISDQCARRESGWPSLFCLTMLWGFGENDKAGPVKLFEALRTINSEEPIAERCITKAACLARSGDYRSSLEEIMKLDESGPSYATKFVYSVAASRDNGLKALILDSKVGKALREFNMDGAMARYGLSENGSPNKQSLIQPERYQTYCSDMGYWATELDCDPEQLEYSFFVKTQSKDPSEKAD
jgi:hypothetical protein